MSKVIIQDDDIFAREGDILKPEEFLYEQGHKALDDPAYYPKPEHWNYFWNMITKNFQFTFRHALLPWDSDEQYDTYALVYVGTRIYSSKIANNKNNAPSESEDEWLWINKNEFDASQVVSGVFDADRIPSAVNAEEAGSGFGGFRYTVKNDGSDNILYLYTS